MDVTVQIARDRQDIREIATLAKAIWEEYYTPLLGMEQVAYMLETIQSEEAMERQRLSGMVYALILADGMPVGYYAVKDEGDRLFLSKMYILANVRGKGVFRTAFSHVLAHAEGKKSIYLTVNKGNDSTIGVYRHMGFETTREEVSDIGHGYVMDDYIMEYTIGHCVHKSETEHNR